MRFVFSKSKSFYLMFVVALLMMTAISITPTRAASSTCGTGTNLIANSGFESGSLNPWTLVAGNGGPTQARKYAGNWAGYVGTNTGRIEQIVNGLSPNTSYTLCGWYTLETPASTIQFGVKNHGGTQQTQTVTTSASFVWVQLSLNFTTGPSSTSATIFFEQPTSGGNYGYSDDWWLVAGGVSGATPTNTVGASATQTITPTASRTSTSVSGASATRTITPTASRTPTNTVGATNTPTNGLTATKTPTPSITFTRTATSSGPTPTKTATPTLVPVGSIVPLFNSSTVLEPAVVEDIGSAIVTRFGDRARDRHARELIKMYDHFLPLYWEFRTVGIEIIDTVAKGGSTITANITTLHQMDTPDFRAFYMGVGVLSNYFYAVNSTEIDPFHYTVTIDKNYTTNQPLQVGDRMEIEFSQFIQLPLEGRNNYYGTSVLYTVGTGGLVPWEGHGANLDSFKIPEENWLGGTTTLPRNYSNEPMQAFKQTAGNISPTSMQPFMLGRRLHHTNFADGSHSEGENPIFTEQIGKLGPRYSAYSCLGCHTNNGRALSPGVSTVGFNVEFFAKNAPWADLVLFINGVEESHRMDHDVVSNNNTYIIRDVPGGATVQYRFTIGVDPSGQTTTSFTTFTMAGGTQASNGSYGHFTLEPELQYVFKVGADAAGASLPTLGKVLQPRITSGTPEGGVTLSGWTTVNGTYGDGTPYTLRSPNFTFSGVVPPYYSARIAPQLVGMGLLEAVDESVIAALADPNDTNADGISGRLQIVTDPQTGQQRLGRFGWKAGQARVSQQVASALNNDMGVTTTIFPNLDCGSAQGACGSGSEISSTELDQMTRYVSLLGVPPRRTLTTQASTGQSLFASAGCVKCHSAQLTTSPFHPFGELRNQTIHPYTDLLLHDMGLGLASSMGEANASGAEWRTAPLWGLSYGIAVSGGEGYLHDGRARTLAEAILWHGGEANAAKEVFRTMPAANRDALIAFLMSQ